MSVNKLKINNYNTDSYCKNIYNKADSVFVSANAGSGKTSLLTRRVLALLLQGAAPSKILCLTYTKAAAAEMEQRVLARLGEWVMEDELRLKATLSDLLGRMPELSEIKRARSLFATVLDAPEGVRIQTIHGFCQSLLTRFPLEAGINPNFAVLDDRSAGEMLREAKIELLNQAQGDLRAAIARLARLLSAADFDGLLAAVIAKKFAFRSLLGQPGGRASALSQLAAAMGIAAADTQESLINEQFRYDDTTRAALLHISEILLKGSGKTDSVTGRALADWLAADAVGRAKIAGHYIDAFVTQAGTARTTLYTKKTLPDPEKVSLLLREQDKALWLHSKLCSLRILECNADMLAVAEALLSIYDGHKQRHAALDYDDLIFTARELLSRDQYAAWVLYKLDGGIDHVLVDEAQDTSPEQWAIVRALTDDFFAGESRGKEERSLFIVGDEKQSIFSFQGAEVRLLGQMRDYFHDRINGAGKNSHRLSLTHSYRSVPEVLAAVDAVFAAPDAAAGVTSEMLHHIPNRSQHGGLVELWPLVIDEEFPVARMARLLADTIHGWLAHGLWLEGHGRNAHAGDIMILVRKREPLADVLTRALKRRGIPVAGADRMVLSDNLAVRDLIALGEFLLLPEDDLTLASLLKSPICNLTEDELMALASSRGSQSLWDRLQSGKEHAPVAELLRDLRGKADFIPPFELFSHVLTTLNMRARFVGRMGLEYHEALDEFLAQAMLFQKSNPPSLQLFIHWMKGDDSQVKRDMEQAHNAVRIMTVHGSKGLQAPIVILPDTLSKPGFREKLVWHEANGMPQPVWVSGKEHDDHLTGTLRESAQVRMMEEYRRLLYVAMTRAEDRLYVCGASRKEDPVEDCWYSYIRRGVEPLAACVETPTGQGLRIASPHLNDAGYQSRGIGEGISHKKPSKISPVEGTSYAFLSASSLAEENPPRPLAPSSLGEEPAAASPVDSSVFARGLLIHSLLQYLPDMQEASRLAVAENCARPYLESLGDDGCNACISEAIALISDPTFATIFSPQSIVEAPVTGTVVLNGKTHVVSGQIDRLLVTDKEVWIIDYKTNRVPPDSKSISLSYRKQMALYRLLLQTIFPGRVVHAALLWTAIPRIDVLDEEALNVLDSATQK